jgi:hypothetical protein
VNPHPYAHLPPEVYQHLRDAAQRRALQLREEAIREAHVRMARLLRRGVRGAMQFVCRLRLPRSAAAAIPSPTQEFPTPCQPSF